MDKPRIVIFMHGGLIQDIYTNCEVEIAKIDYDVDGIDDEELSLIKDEDGNTNSGYVSLWTPEVSSEWTDHFYHQVHEAVKNGEGR